MQSIFIFFQLIAKFLLWCYNDSMRKDDNT